MTGKSRLLGIFSPFIVQLIIIFTIIIYCLKHTAILWHCDITCFCDSVLCRVAGHGTTLAHTKITQQKLYSPNREMARSSGGALTCYKYMQPPPPLRWAVPLHANQAWSFGRGMIAWTQHFLNLLKDSALALTILLRTRNWISISDEECMWLIKRGDSNPVNKWVELICGN